MTCRTVSMALTGVLCALMLHVCLIEAGSLFVRWGRTTCPPGANVVYKGYIAGAHQDHIGSASNVLCTHEKPQWGKNNVPGRQDYAGYLFGAEFEFHPVGGYPDDKPFERTNADGAPLLNRDGLCAMCYVPNSSANAMIPGRQDCGEGNDYMTLQYKGYLVSEYWYRKRTEFICMDEAPEARPGSQADENGLLMFPVQAVCGSLPCPAYVDGNEVTCAVCSV